MVFFSLLVGDPELDGGDDFHHIAVASQLSWPRILESVVLFKPNPHGYASGGVMNYALSSRIGYTVVIKSIHDFFGSSRVPYFMAQRVIGDLCLVLLMYLVWCLTSSVGWSIFSGLFYFFLPMEFLQTLWLSDFSELVHLFTLLTFVLIHRIYRRWLALKRFTVVDFFLAVAAAVSTFLAIKTKPSGLIIPAAGMIFALYLLLRSRRLRWFGIAGLLTIGILSVWMVLTKHVELYPSSFWRLAFQNVNNEYEWERISAFFDISSVLPVSLARNVNFFFLWLCVAAILYLFIRRKKVERPEILFVFFWLIFEILFYLIIDNAPRYVSDAMLPLICLISVLLQSAWKQLRHAPIKIMMTLWFLTGCIFGLVNNFQHLVFLRNWKTGYFNELATPPQIIWNDLHGLPLYRRNSIEETVAFAWPKIVQQTRDELMPDFLRNYTPPVLFSDYVISSDVVDLPKPTGDKNFHGSYVISYSPHLDNENCRLLASFQKVPPSPLVDFVSQFKKKKIKENIYIYKCT